MLIGVKTEKKLKVDFVDVEFGGAENPDKRKFLATEILEMLDLKDDEIVAEDDVNAFMNVDAAHPKLRRTSSRAFLSEDGQPIPMEYFLASDPSAIIEHTKRVMYLEDDDIAHITEGGKLK